LPNELQVVPMNVPDGTHQMSLCVYRYVTPLAEIPFEVTVDGSRPLNVVHVFPRDLGRMEVTAMLGRSARQQAWFSMAKTGYFSVDTNRDGEISSLEMKNAHTRLLHDYDANKNGVIDDAEWAVVNRSTNAAFRSGMVKQ
jgi:hypothetical protein